MMTVIMIGHQPPGLKSLDRRGGHKHVLQEVPSRNAAVRRHKWDRIVFCEDVLSEIATIRSLLKSSGRLQRRPDCFCWGSLRRNAKIRSSPHLAIIILKGRMKAPDDRHGGLCNIVPGPRCLTGTAKRAFLDLCGPDFLIQGVVGRHQAFSLAAMLGRVV